MPPTSLPRRSAALPCVLLLALSAAADDPDLAGYFGFDGLEIIKIDNGAGPFITADVNGDGLLDLIVANNAKSRLEVHYQKAGAKPTDEVAPPSKINELPEHWRFRREYVSVGHQITGLAAIDFDADGLLDFIYSGQPGTIAFVRQVRPGVFETIRRIPVRGLVGNRDAFAVADLVGDAGPDVAALVGGRLTIWPIEGSSLGDSVELGSGGDALVAMVLGDYDGDGTTDVAGIVPDNAAPVRIWLGMREGDSVGGRKALGPQLRFEMPPLREAAAVPLPNRAATALATIERPSRRIVVNELRPATVEASGLREAPVTVWNFADPSNRKRSIAIVDVDGDGYQDLVATNTLDNALSVFRQLPGRGLQPPVNFPAYAELDSVVAYRSGGSGGADLFVLSEKEGVVGRTRWDEGAIPFPQALPITAGHTPVVANLVQLESGAKLAVVTREGRNYLLELLPVDGGPASESIKLGSLAKQPDTIVALDADRDGLTDLLLFTADRPMIMVRGSDKGYTVLESKDMGQFGLVQAANDKNVAIFDPDGEGRPELLVADRNFVRALRYDPAPAEGTSPGWQVVAQFNADRGDAKIVSIATFEARDGKPARIVAADRENSALLVFSRDPQGRWSQTDTLIVSGFRFNALRAGAFSGDGREDVIALGDDGFAVVRLEGTRLRLDELAAWRSESPRRMHHELVVGDVNADGRVDIVAIDAAEQMADILTFSDALRLLYATGFKIFESRMFSGGEPREFEPSMGAIVDLTGDGANDLLFLSHDRILLYPQSTRPK